MDKETFVLLKNNKVHKLAVTQRGQFRMESLGVSENTTDFTFIARVFWAYQIGRNPKNTPEDIAEQLDMVRKDEYIDKVTFILGIEDDEQTPEITEQKKTKKNGSKDGQA